MTNAITVATFLLIGMLCYLLLRYQKIELLEKFTIWFIFSVLIALTPILFNIGRAFIYNESVKLPSLLENGELLIISVAIGADALGKIIGGDSGNKKQNLLKVIAGGACLLLIIFSSYFFSTISNEPELTSIGSDGQNLIDSERTSAISQIIFFLTILTSGSCLLLSEVDQ